MKPVTPQYQYSSQRECFYSHLIAIFVVVIISSSCSHYVQKNGLLVCSMARLFVKTCLNTDVDLWESYDGVYLPYRNIIGPAL